MITLFNFFKCIFIEDDWSCLDCYFKDKICDNQFYNKYGRLKHEDD